MHTKLLELAEKLKEKVAKIDQALGSVTPEERELHYPYYGYLGGSKISILDELETFERKLELELNDVDRYFEQIDKKNQLLEAVFNSRKKH